MERQNLNPYSTTIETDGKIYWGESTQLAVRIDSEGIIAWTDQVNLADYPSVDFVKDGVVFDNGNLTGTLGAINSNNPDIAEQIRAKIETLLEETLPSDYAKMRYLLDPTKNDFYSNAKQYGVIIEEDEQDLDQTVFQEDVVDLSFEIIMSNDWVENSNEDDLNARQSFRELKQRMELIRRKIKETRAGTYNTGKLNSPVEYSTSAPEYNFDDNIVILRAFITVKYRVK